MGIIRNTLVFIGYGAFIVTGVAMFLFEIYWFNAWWGVFGLIVAVVVAPLAAMFPFIYLVKEGFSLFYFGLWGLGIAGGLLAGSLSD